MGIVRTRNFAIPCEDATDNVELIDTPEKLLRWAVARGYDLVPFPIEKVIAAMGIAIQRVHLEDDLSGMLFKDLETDAWKIHVNQNHHPNRQRYTIAHELGHYCLHKHLCYRFEDEVFFRGGEATPTEWQANQFASSILMPEQVFKEKVRSGVRKVEDLAQIFQVSTLALRLRAKALGMAGHGL